MSNETTNNRPADKFRVGSTNVSIWRNSTDKGEFYSATFERRYKDKDGNWKSRVAVRMLVKTSHSS